MPGDDEKLVAGEEVPDDIGIRENGAEHEGPRDDAATVHRVRGKQVLAAENGFSD